MYLTHDLSGIVRFVASWYTITLTRYIVNFNYPNRFQIEFLVRGTR